MVFSSFGSEIPTEGIIRRLVDKGRRVLLPYMAGPEMLAAEIRRGDPLVPTTYGPKEPSHRVAVDRSEIDVVIAPGLAFDRSGYRLGYGGGNYDRFLARLGGHTTRIGIAFHVQLLPSVPHEPGDVPMDYVVTDQETIDR